MDSEPVEAQVTLDQLEAGRDAALDRLFMPWGYAVGLAVLLNACLLTVVLPIVLSNAWVVLAIQGSFATGAGALALAYRRRQPVLRAAVRPDGDWIVTAAGALCFAGALALAVVARNEDLAWLGGLALVVNTLAFLLVYRGQATLVRRRVSAGT